MVRGSVITPEGRPDQTIYACCIDAQNGVYYYKTRENPRPVAVRMDAADLDGAALCEFALRRTPDILFEGEACV